jgi:hypothetical protein
MRVGEDRRRGAEETDLKRTWMSSGAGGVLREAEDGRGGAGERGASDHTGLSQLQARRKTLYLGCTRGRVSGYELCGDV